MSASNQEPLCQVLFPVIPQLCDLERLKQGGEHWQWSPETPFYIGVIPRYGAKSSDVKVSGILQLILSILLFPHTPVAVVHIQEFIPGSYRQCLRTR